MKKEPWYITFLSGAIIFLLVLLTALIIFLIYICMTVFDISDINASFLTIMPVMSCIVSALGLIIAGINYTKSRAEYILSNRVSSYKKWYKELITTRHFTDLVRFFDNIGELIELAKTDDFNRNKLDEQQYNDNVKYKLINPFTSSYNEIYLPLTKDCDVVNKFLSIEISKIFMNMQDDFTTKAVADRIDTKDLSVTFDDYYRNIMKLIMEYEDADYNIKM